MNSPIISFGATRETKATLRIRAQELGLTGYEKLKKAELSALVHAEEAKQFNQYVAELIAQRANETADTPAVEATPAVKEDTASVQSKPASGTFTVKELRATAKALSIAGYSRMNKAELEHAISMIENAPDVDIPDPEEAAAQSAAVEEHAETAQATVEPATSTASTQPVCTGPTDKSGDSYYHFTCKTPKELRKILNTGTLETVKAIAESYVEFQPRTDGKRMSKKFYVDAIVRLYFPQEQEKPAPVKQARPEFQGERFVKGKVYVQTRWGENKLYKVIQRKRNRITLVEVSPHDFTEYLSAPEDRTVKYIGTITEYITPSHRYYGDLLATREYSRVLMETPNMPGCDVDFDKTAYGPDSEANLAVLDDVPEDRDTETATAPAPIVVLEQPVLAQPVPAPTKKQPATATHKPRRRTHRRHEDTRTILIDFGDEAPKTPITDTTPEIPCIRRRTTRRRASVKIDYSRQLILLFDDEPEAFGGHDDQRKAA